MEKIKTISTDSIVEAICNIAEDNESDGVPFYIRIPYELKTKLECHVDYNGTLFAGVGRIYGITLMYSKKYFAIEYRAIE